MPWKEPGEKPREPRGREPWGPRPGGGGNGGPDLEAWLRKARRSLGPFGHGPLSAIALVVLALVLWFAIGGWTMVGNQQVGVLLRFGRLEGVLQPGLHFHIPVPVDRVRVVDLGRTRTLSDDVRLLTADGQLAMVDYYVQYKIADARKFLFSSRDAEETARNAATIAVRAVVGSHDLGELMTRSDDKLDDAIRSRLQAALAQADLGITLSAVGIQNVGVPAEVKQAFDDIAKAHEDAKAAVATAHADVSRHKVEAAAQAASLKASAESYRSTTIAEAHSDVARFDQILTQYRAAPQVTSHRLWLQAMHDVLANNRVVVNTGTGSVIVQFPPHQPQSANGGAPAAAGSSAPASPASAPAAAGSSTPPVTSGPGVRGGEA
ncbi:MAG TPA: FtsH protease activity modulator HflK [Rhodanobacteraceae bacterium]|jgi:membrane protease subunit HflK|nr:FtsH protease activity modulator HflK [Rhodanobacteraceae bacterium]